MAEKPNEPPGEFAWLIEGDGCYWDGRGVKASDFTTKVNDAIRFSRFRDANVVRFHLLAFAAFALRVTQHGFV